MLVGSLSGRPISVLVAGPVAELIAKQLGETGPEARKIRQAAVADAAPPRPHAPALLPAPGEISEGAGYQAVLTAYAEF